MEDALAVRQNPFGVGDIAVVAIRTAQAVRNFLQHLFHHVHRPTRTVIGCKRTKIQISPADLAAVKQHVARFIAAQRFAFIRLRYDDFYAAPIGVNFAVEHDVFAAGDDFAGRKSEQFFRGRPARIIKWLIEAICFVEMAIRDQRTAALFDIIYRRARLHRYSTPKRRPVYTRKNPFRTE